MSTTPQKVLVPGGAGYLGSVLVPRLLEAGYAVRVVDDFRYRQTSLLPCFVHPRFECLPGDVRDRELMKRAVEDADVIVNLAALVGAPLCARYDKDAWEINVEAALLLDELRGPGQKYIYPNSTSGYGTRTTVDGNCDENVPQEPISVYGKSKVAAEEELLKRPEIVTYRFTTVFGCSPRMRLDLMPNDFMWKAMKQGALVIFEGHFKRSFLHVTDVTRCILFTLEHFDAMQGRCFNVGHERMNFTKKELAEKISEFTGCFLHFTELREDPDKRNYFISFKRIQEVGFDPQVGWEQGLRELHQGLQTLRWDIPFANVEYY